MIIDDSIKAHHNVLVGFKGSKNADKTAFAQSQTVKHVALSLTGEPILYPKINEVIDGFHKRGVSTFLVTNAQYPEQIKTLHPITQLYISLDAPTKELLKEIDVPLFTDYWERLQESLKYLAEKKARTCIRVTAIKGINMILPEKWAEQIMNGDPDFIEVKAYMHVGASQERLEKENMPWHQDIVDFSREIVKYLPDYEIMGEHIPSRVVCIAKKKYKQDGVWRTWLDFDKFFADIPNDTEGLSYSRETPETGISGKDTPGRVFIDEKTEELEFWKKEKEE